MYDKLQNVLPFVIGHLEKILDFCNLLEVDDLSHVSHLVADSLKGSLYQ
jgi:hypothetical protein